MQALWLAHLAATIAMVVALALLAVAWASTFTLQVPLHRALLERGFDVVAHRRLLWTNWVRTVAWSGRAGLLLATAPLVVG